MDDPLARAPVGINAMPLLSPLSGIGQYTLHLIEHMRRLLAQPPWLFYGGAWSRDVRDAPVPSAPTPVQRLKQAIPYPYFAARALQQWRFDAGVRANGVALYHEPNFLAFRFDGPSVVTVHDLSWVRHPETHPAQRVKVMNAAMPRVVAAAAQIIVDSEFVRGEVIEHYALPPERVTSIPLGVPSGFSPLAEAQCAPMLAAHGLRYRGYVLAVGTLEPRKNLDTVIAAYARLSPAERRNHPLVIAGLPGWGMERLSALLRERFAADDVRLLGYVDRDSLPRLYSAARAFVYPSLYEGFGLPPLEAMACGTPVVVSNRASLPELVGAAGVQVDALDDAALAAAIRALLQDDALHARYSAAGIEQARKFTWDACAQRTLTVYRRALGG